MTNTKVTGDISNFTAVQKEGVMLHQMPHVLVSELTDIKHNVNNASVSGKRLGSMLVGVVMTGNAVTTAALYSPSGSDPDSKWMEIHQLVGQGSTDIQPV